MSIPVSVDALAQAMEGYGFAYLLTVSDDLRAHAVAAAPRWDGEALVMEAGRRTVANAAARPSLSVVWPPVEVGGYSLICDGEATVNGQIVRLVPQRAVLHRPADHGAGAGGSVEGGASAGSCGADCAPIGG